MPVEKEPIKKYFSAASLLLRLRLSLPVKMYKGIEMISIPRNSISSELKADTMAHTAQHEKDQCKVLCQVHAHPLHIPSPLSRK